MENILEAISCLIFISCINVGNKLKFLISHLSPLKLIVFVFYNVDFVEENEGNGTRGIGLL